MLRAKGIIPEKEKGITEEQIVQMMEQTILDKQVTSKFSPSRIWLNVKCSKFITEEKEMSARTLDELDELEDSEDEAVLEQYRRQRIAEIQALATKAKYGRVLEISAQDYIKEVNQAGEDVWVVLHLYKQGIQLCALINQFLSQLCVRYPATKFIKAISTTCIPNYPDKNVPSIFIYHEGKIKKQIIGSIELRGDKLTADEFEYLLGLYEAIPTDIKEDPRRSTKDTMFAELASDNNDW